MKKIFSVYIITNKCGTLYTGVSSALEQRNFQHKTKYYNGFTSRYNISKLVYFETTENANAAIAREKQIKGWTRAKKIVLIDSMNPEWKDLSLEWMA